MTPALSPTWAWPLLILGVLGWASTGALVATICARDIAARRTAAAADGPDEAYETLPSRNEKPPAPASDTAREPGPVIHPHYKAQLDAISKRMVTPGTIDAARIVADGLRTEFPELDDLTLGLVVVHLYGYARTLTLGLPEQVDAAQQVVDLFGLTAEDLTRLARTDTPR